MAINPIMLRKENPDEFSLLYELNDYAQGVLLIHTITFLEDNLEAVAALFKTCKFFNEYLQEMRQIIENYHLLIGRDSIFSNWKEIKKLPFYHVESTIINSCHEKKHPADFINSINYPIIRGKYPSGQGFLAFKYSIKKSNGQFLGYGVDNFMKKDKIFSTRHYTTYEDPLPYSETSIFYPKRKWLENIDYIENNQVDYSIQIFDRIHRLFKHEPVGRKEIGDEEDSEIKTTPDGSSQIELIPEPETTN